jgi:hypothetical protein
MANENPCTFLDVLFCCIEAVKKYPALRTELFQQLMRLPSGWGIRYRRDSTQGEPLLPPRVTQHTATISELGGQPFEGIAAFTMLETYAPFSEFEVLSPDGKRATSGTEPAILEMRLGFLLRELLDNMKVLAGSLAIIEREKGLQRWSTDTTPLSHLAEELPVFPYWPKIDGRSQSFLDGILAEEKPRLDAARLSLRLLTVEIAGRQGTASAVVEPKTAQSSEHWLPATSLADLANRLGNVGIKKVKTMMKPYQLRMVGNRQSWTVRLDDMPANIRAKLEQGR